MATRKQRRRREKTFRHDYGFVVNDEEGNEVEVAGSELRARRGEKDAPARASAPAKAASGTKPARRGARDPEPPSWSRSLRRGVLWGIPIIVVSLLLLRGVSTPARAGIGIVYAAMFVPITYWMDGVVYRRFQKRKAAEPRQGRGRS